MTELQTPPASDAARLLRAAAVVAVPAPSRDDRARAIERLADEIGRAAWRRRARTAVVVVLASAAAVTLLFFGARGLRPAPRSPIAQPAAPALPVHVAVAEGGGGVSLLRGTGEIALPAVLEQGDRLFRTGSTEPIAAAALSLSTGTTLQLGSATEARVDLADAMQQVLHLSKGTLESHVAPLPAGGRFVVRTIDAEVEVHGTRFRVDVLDEPLAGCTPRARTRVIVSEGVVVVRYGATSTTLVAGEELPRCHPAAIGPSAIAPSGSLPVTPHKADPASSTVGSALSIQNALYAEAMDAKKRGDRGAARRLLEKLAADYPTGPHAESALVERMRLLDGDAARVAAKDYLVRFPSGFARDEARTLIGPTP